MKSADILVAFMIIFPCLLPITLYFWFKHKRFKRYIQKLQDLPTEKKQIEIMKLQTQIDKYKTSHTLHLFLSIFTVSIWIIPWFFIAQSNQSKRNLIQNIINSI